MPGSAQSYWVIELYTTHTQCTNLARTLTVFFKHHCQWLLDSLLQTPSSQHGSRAGLHFAVTLGKNTMRHAFPNQVLVVLISVSSWMQTSKPFNIHCTIILRFICMNVAGLVYPIFTTASLHQFLIPYIIPCNSSELEESFNSIFITFFTYTTKLPAIRHALDSVIWSCFNVSSIPRGSNPGEAFLEPWKLFVCSYWLRYLYSQVWHLLHRQDSIHMCALQIW